MFSYAKQVDNTIQYFVLVRMSLTLFVLLELLVQIPCRLSAEPFMIRKILTRADGLPSNTLRSIICDKQGLFWIVTEKGICRYDGQKLYPLPLPSSKNPALNFSALEQSMFGCAEDSTGAVWFATASGLLCFIPKSGVWKWYQQKNSPIASLLNQITSLHCAKDGTLWIGTHGGLLRYDKTLDSCKVAFPKLPQESISVICEGLDGRIWFSVGQKTLATYQPQTGTILATTPKGCEAGLYLHAFTNATNLRKRGVWISPLSGANQVMEAPRLLSLDTVHNIYVIEPSAFAVTSEFIRGIDLFPASEDEHGAWFIRAHDYAAGRCENGLYRIIPKQETRDYPTATASPSNESTLFREQILRGMIIGFSRNPRSGIVCVGVSGQGLYVLMPTGTDRVAKHTAIGNAISILTDKRGRTWLGTDKGLFLHKENNSVAIPFSSAEVSSKRTLTGKTASLMQQAPSPVYDIQETSTGTILIGSNNGLFRFDEATNSLRPFPTLTASLGITTVRRIAADPFSREFWINAPAVGVVRCREDGTPLGYFPIGQPASPTDTMSLGASNITSITFDKRGHLWIGGVGVLLRWRREKGVLERLTVLPDSKFTPTPMKINSSSQKSLITALYGIGLGVINLHHSLVGDFSAGAFIRLAPFNTRLPDIQINSIASTNSILWWTTNSNGIYRSSYTINSDSVLSLRHPQLILPSDNNTSTKGNTENATNQESERGWNVGAMTSDGKGGVLFDYYGDVLRADSRARAFTDTARVMSVGYFRNDSAMANIPQHGDTLVCSYNGSFSLACAVVSLIRPERHRLEYLLEGVDNVWNSMQDASLRTVRYSSLPPGNYRLFIRTSAQDPTEDAPLYSANVLTLTVSVPYPWWRHPVTLTGGFMLIAVLFYNLGSTVQHRRNLRQLQQLEREKQVEELQRMVSEAQMQTLRLQMNPHFLYNALAEIQLLVETGNSLASYYIAIFSKLLTRVLRHAGKEFVSISDEITILKQYMALEELRNAGKLRCYVILIPESDDGETDGGDDHNSEYWKQREIPTFVLQPFIENAIRHGIRGLEEEDWATRESGGIITVQIREEEGMVTCTIEDNGIGRVEAARRKALRQGQHLSIATSVTTERLKLLTETFGIPLSVYYIDLQDEHGKAVGTQATVMMPCRIKPVETEGITTNTIPVQPTVQTTPK